MYVYVAVQQKVILWEICKKVKLNHTNKWYMYNPESVQENKTQSSLEFWDTNRFSNPSQTTRPWASHQRRKSSLQWNFAVLADSRLKLKERELSDKYHDPSGELKYTTEHEDDGNTNCNWST